MSVSVLWDAGVTPVALYTNLDVQSATVVDGTELDRF